jgi:hypothetical protein
MFVSVATPEITRRSGQRPHLRAVEVLMSTSVRLLAAALLLATSLPARADVIEASSTTLMTAGQQLAGTTAGQVPELVRVMPVYELIRVSAREVRNPLFQDLEISFSGWGAADLSEVHWDAGTNGKLNGDVSTAYVRGTLARGVVQLRAGREFVAAGAGRMLQLDGGDLFLRLPAGFTVSVFGGLPVSQRFSSRSGLASWNPAGGNLAWGGRLGWTLALPGASGRVVDVGVSMVSVTDHSDPVRQDLGIDFRAQPIDRLVLVGNTTYSLYAQRVAEYNLTALLTATRTLAINLDLRHYSPDLFLARNSILSVFTDTNRTDVGGGVRWQAVKTLSLSLDYHVLLEPGLNNQGEVGAETALRVEWESHGAVAGGEVTYLKTGETGYAGVRGFGRKQFGKLFMAADLAEVMFRQEVYKQKSSLSGSVSAGYQLTRAWSLVLAGRAGVTPFFERQADAMLKLVYNSTIRIREVR